MRVRCKPNHPVIQYSLGTHIECVSYRLPPLFHSTAELPPVEINFIDDTPIVTDNDIMVRLSVSPPVPLLCQLITRGLPRMPIFTQEQDCELQTCIAASVSCDGLYV